MRKNRLLSPQIKSGKKLKLPTSPSNRPNLSKAKSPQCGSLKGSLRQKQKISSSKRIQNKKPPRKVSIAHKAPPAFSQLSQAELTWSRVWCPNSDLQKQLRMYSLFANQQFDCQCDAKDNELFFDFSSESKDRTADEERIVAISHLKDFTQMYVQYAQAVRAQLQTLKCDWMILSEAVNCKELEANFNKLYTPISFQFVSSIFEIVNYLNLSQGRIQTKKMEREGLQVNSGFPSFDSLFRLSVSKRPFRDQSSVADYKSAENVLDSFACIEDKVFEFDFDLIKGSSQQFYVALECELKSIFRPNNVYFCSEHTVNRLFEVFSTLVPELRKFMKEQQELICRSQQQNQNEYELSTEYKKSIKTWKDEDPLNSAIKMLSFIQSFTHHAFYLFPQKLLNEYLQNDSRNNLPNLEKLKNLKNQQKSYFFALIDEKNGTSEHEWENFFGLEARQAQILENCRQLSKFGETALSVRKLRDIQRIVGKVVQKNVVNPPVEDQKLQTLFFLCSQSDSLKAFELLKYIQQELSKNRSDVETYFFLCRAQQKEGLYSFIEDLLPYTSKNAFLFYINSLAKNQHLLNSRSWFHTIALSPTENIKIVEEVNRKLRIIELMQKKDLHQVFKKIAVYQIIDSGQSESPQQSYKSLKNIKEFEYLTSCSLTKVTLANIIQKMESSKNKINILFGKIQNREIEQKVFETLLVIYLPKAYRVSLQKVLITIEKAHTRYFDIFQHRVEETQQSPCCVHVFEISTFKGQIRQESRECIESLPIVEFKDCLKRIALSEGTVKNHYMIFAMESFQEELEKEIENVRIKTDKQIQIYLKYGDEYIYRPKNGNYKFIKFSELKTKLESYKAQSQNQPASDAVADKRAHRLSSSHFRRENEIINQNLGISDETPLKYSIQSACEEVYPQECEEKETNSTQNVSNSKKTDLQQLLQLMGGPTAQQPSFISQKSDCKQIETESMPLQPNASVYIFISKRIPLNCLQNRSIKPYKLLTYNSISEVFYSLPEFALNDMIVILTQKSLRVRQAMETPRLKKMQQKKRLFIRELKTMGQEECKKIIDDLVIEFKLGRCNPVPVRRPNRTLPVLIYEQGQLQNECQAASVKNMSLKSPQKKSKGSKNLQGSLSHVKSEYLLQTRPLKSPSNKHSFGLGNAKQHLDESFDPSIEYCSKFGEDIDSSIFEDGSRIKSSLRNSEIEQTEKSHRAWIYRLMEKFKVFQSYFLVISHFEAVEILCHSKIQSIGEKVSIDFLYFGSNQTLKLIEEGSGVPVTFLQSRKQVLLRYFSPYLQPIQFSDYLNNFAVKMSEQIVMGRDRELRRLESKVAPKLWSKSKKSVSLEKGPELNSVTSNDIDSSRASSQSSRQKYQLLNRLYSSSNIGCENRTLRSANYCQVFYSRKVGLKSKNSQPNIRIGKSSFRLQRFDSVEQLLLEVWESRQMGFFTIIVIQNDELSDLMRLYGRESESSEIIPDSFFIVVEGQKRPKSKGPCGKQFQLLLNLLNNSDHKQQSKNVLYRAATEVEATLLKTAAELDKEIERIHRELYVLNHEPENQLQIHIIHHRQDHDYLLSCIKALRSLTDEPSAREVTKKRLSRYTIELLPVNCVTEAIGKCSSSKSLQILVIPTEWAFLKIRNGILIDYQQQNFQRRLSLYLNNLINAKIAN